MASFIAKQMVGNKLSKVKGALGDKEEKEEGKEGEEQGEDPEIAEARREAEEKRKEKHRKMEAEREEMRQSIRDKYGLKKKEVTQPEDDPDMEGRLGRKRKTPAEMAAEANADSDDELQNSVFPKDLNDLTSKVQQIPGKVMTSVSEVSDKCVMQ